MKITPEILRNLYASMCCAYPFTKWNMPLPEEVLFEITHDIDALGTYLLDTEEDYQHHITISSARCAFWDTICRTLAHECVHMSFYRQKGDKWMSHGVEFRRRCRMVAEEFGFDPLEL
jgi:hypothetical protein